MIDRIHRKFTDVSDGGGDWFTFRRRVDRLGLRGGMAFQCGDARGGVTILLILGDSQEQLQCEQDLVEAASRKRYMAHRDISNKSTSAISQGCCGVKSWNLCS